jgi:hypothetical protein
MLVGLAAELKLERVIPSVIVAILWKVYNFGLFLTAAPPLVRLECNLSFFLI